MEGLEEISFEIISHSGQAKAEIMEAVTCSKSDAKDPEPLLKDAKEELKVITKLTRYICMLKIKWLQPKVF